MPLRSWSIPSYKAYTQQKNLFFVYSFSLSTNRILLILAGEALYLIIDRQLLIARPYCNNQFSKTWQPTIKFAFLIRVRFQTGLSPIQTIHGLLNTPNNVNKPSLTKIHRHATAQLRFRKAILGDARYG